MTTPAARAACALAATLALSAFAGTPQAPTDLDPKVSCSSKDCHDAFAKKKHVHGPISVDECKACHVWKDNKHKFTLAQKGTTLCTSCHDDIEIGDAKKKDEKKDEKKGPESEGKKEQEKRKLVVHEPVKEDCANCHDPHAADHKGLLTAPLLELCETCHDETFAKIKSKEALSTHATALKGKACLSCHVVHSGKHPRLLAAAANDLCLSCHDKEIQAGQRVVASTKAELTLKGATVHGPIEDEGCVMCHDGHGSPHVALLKRAYPPTFYAAYEPKTYALCFECHEAGLATQAETEDATEFRNGTRNLHHVHVHKDRKGRSCRFCHAPHASALPHQLRASVPFGRVGWQLPLGFKPTKTGGTCTSGCHAPKSYDREQPVKP